MGWDGMGQACTAMEWDGMGQKNMSHGQAWRLPLGPTLANFFLTNLENKLLDKTNGFYPKIDLRYVNDIFAIFDDNLLITKFLNLLNKQHSNMQFTMEKSMHALQFLDVRVQIRENELDLSMRRKETSTGILMNFNAICPNVCKSSHVLCLLN